MLGAFFPPYHQHHPRCLGPQSLFLKFVIILLLEDSCLSRVIMVGVLKYQSTRSRDLVTVRFIDGNYKYSSRALHRRRSGELTTGMEF